MNYWMFETGEYWGVDIGYLTILFGLSSKMNRKLVNERGTEQLKLINGDMLRHIGELGPFDLAVSTYTLELIPKESLFQVVESMVQTISVKGNLILSDITTDGADSLQMWMCFITKH